MIKKLALLPYKLTFRPPLVYFRPAVKKIIQQTRIKKWLWHFFFSNSQIHSSLEISGKKDFPDFIKLGEFCVLERDCFIWIADETGADPLLDIHTNVFLGRNVYLGVYQPITIEENCLIGAYTYIISANHVYKNRNTPIFLQGYNGAPVHIGKDVWVGCHVVILPGVSIGEGAVVAAGAVVNKSIPPYEIWGGVPAKKIGSR